MNNIRINGYKVLNSRSAEAYKPDSMVLMESITSGLKTVESYFDKIKTIESLTNAYANADTKSDDSRTARSMESDFKLFGTTKFGIAVVGGIALGIAAIVAIFKNFAKIAGWLASIAGRLFGFLNSIFAKFRFAVNKDGKDPHTVKSVINKLVEQLIDPQYQYTKFDYLYLNNEKKAVEFYKFIEDLDVASGKVQKVTSKMIQEIDDLYRRNAGKNMQDIAEETHTNTTTQGKGKNAKTHTTTTTTIDFLDVDFSDPSSYNDVMRDLENYNERITNLTTNSDISAGMEKGEAYGYLNTVYHDMQVGTVLSKRVKATQQYMESVQAKFQAICTALDRYNMSDSFFRGRNVPIIDKWVRLNSDAKSVFQQGLLIVQKFERCCTNVTKTYNSIMSELNSAKDFQKFEQITSAKAK